MESLLEEGEQQFVATKGFGLINCDGRSSFGWITIVKLGKFQAGNDLLFPAFSVVIVRGGGHANTSGSHHHIKEDKRISKD